MLKQLLLIGTGGFIGSVARFLVSRLNTRVEWFSIPIGTLTVNVVGSLLIGFLIGISEKSPMLTVERRMFLMVGLCGGIHHLFLLLRREPDADEKRTDPALCFSIQDSASSWDSQPYTWVIFPPN